MIVPQFIPLLGAWPSIALIVATTAFSPAYGLGLGIFIAPIQQFVKFGPQDLHLIHGICWSFIGVRLASLVRLNDLRDLNKLARSPTGLFIAFFVFLVIVHNGNEFLSKYFLLDVGFAGTLLLIVAAIVLADRLPAHLTPIVITAIMSAGFFSIIFDIVLNYVPVLELAPPASVMPPDQLRLAGLHPNPSATSKFILAMQAIVGAASIQPIARPFDRGRLWMWLLYCAVSLALVATATKSAIFAFPLALLGLVAVSISRETWNSFPPWPSANWIGVGSLKVIGLLALIFVVWGIVIAPPLKRHAAIAWLNSGQPDFRGDLQLLAGESARVSATPAPAGSSRQPTLPARDFAEVLRDELRIGQSSQLQAESIQGDLADPFKSVPKGERSVVRDFCIACTGQRDLLWTAGWQTVEDHWLWGIGYGSWKKALFERLRFPFDTPHSGFLELLGEFGLMGAALYIAFALFIARRARSAVLAPTPDGQKPFIIACSLFAMSILATELFEGTKFFAMNPHAIWIWTLLALQERALEEGWLGSPVIPAGGADRDSTNFGLPLTDPVGR
jgi:hypothetical protein